MTLEPSMKFFLACVTTTLALCVPTGSLQAFDEAPAGQTRLSDQPVDPQPSDPQPVPHVIGSDEGAGQATVGGGNVPNLPARSVYYDEPVYPGPGTTGYRMSRDNIFTVQYRLDTRAGGLQGYDDGYTNFGAFIPMMTTPDSLFFTDIRALITNNSNGGMNLGFGRRWYDPAGDRVWSSSVWYDMVNGNSQTYHQGGISASMTSRYLRYRANGYFILGDRNDFIGTQFGNTPFLVGNEINLNRTRTQESAYNGVDFTVGGPMPLLGRFGINWDTGAYYNWSDAGKDGIGWMFNADAQLTEDINMGFRYRNDNVFGANAQLSLLVNLPDGRASRILRQPSIRDYLLKPDERKYNVSVQRFAINDSVPLLNASDGLAIQVANLIPDDVAGVAAAGDGTIENPFNGTDAWNALTGAQKAEFDIVLVRPGAVTPGNDFMNNLTSGMTIVENQRLLASTGRLVRDLDPNGNEIIRYAEHRVTADVAGLGSGLNFGIPGSGVLPDGSSLVGTIFNPTADPRPILANQTTVVSTRPHAVVTIDNSFSVACTSRTEVSGFVIEATNPNQPTRRNNGIVTGNILNPAQGTGVTGFDINSNLIRNAVHGVYLTSLGDSFGTILLNRVEGDGFNSNSGINIYQSGGALGLQFEDNLAFNIFGEDIDNNGVLDTPGGVPGGTEDINGNGKLDIGEDLDGDGVIDVFEDNDMDGILGDDDIGIAFNIVADSVGASIISNNPSNAATNDPANHQSPTIHAATPYDVLAPGLSPNNPVDHLHIARNKTNLSEAEYYRTQTVNAAGEVTNSFTAQDINGDVDLIGTTVVQNSDVFDIVGNKNGMNLEARDGGIFRATVFGNDTSYNNPYVLGLNFGDPDLMPPVKNPFMTVVPTPLGNEFGFRGRSIGAGSILELSSPDDHKSNFNFGNGAILEALNNSTLTMSSPMVGTFTTDPVTGLVNGTTPSEYNDNGLNGLFINGDNNSSLAIQVGDPATAFDHTLTDTADQTTRVYNILNQFRRNGQDGEPTTDGNGILVRLRSGAAFAAGSNSGIYNAEVTDNLDQGILLDLENTTLDNFDIRNSIISGNLFDGIMVSADTAPITNLNIVDNTLNNNGRNGINFQLLDSTLTNLFVENNLMDGNGTLITQNPVSAFDIDVVFAGGLTASQQAIFALAANRWEQLIIGDVPDVGTIDDLQIGASGVAIDGVGGILGQAGPTGIRNVSNIPFDGIMQFDSADLTALENSGQLMDVILHEMGHVIGIGTVWDLQGLLANPSNGDGVTDTRFTGTAATAQYNAIFGTADTGVPVENDFGPGTADSHWRESILDNELMTGFINGATRPISTITVGSLQDLGYVVNMGQADPYTDPTPIVAPLNAPAAAIGTVNNDVGPFQFANATPTPVNLVSIDPGASGNGINISVLNSNLTNAIIENNIITNSTNDGIRLLNPQFATNAEGDNQIHYQLNTITGNGGYGINMSLDGVNHLDAIICTNDISGNTLGGINVELEDDAVYDNGLVPPASLLTPDPADEESWFFGNTINDNGGIGYSITAADNSQFTLVGSTPIASTINGNQDAGLGIIMSQNAVGDIRLDNITISGNQDTNIGDPTDNINFNGEGIGIILRDNSVLDNLRIGDPIVINPANPGTARATTISNNLNNGITIQLFGDSSLQQPLIANTTVSGNGTNGTGDGLNVVRNQFGIVGDNANVLPPVNVIAAANTVPSPIAPLPPTVLLPNTVPDAPVQAFVIRDSIFNNNGGDGIDLTANLPNINDEYLIMQTDISGNGSNGVRLFAQGDAEMLVDIRSSTINNNTGNGINLITNQNNVTDQASITGTWVGTQIDGNGGDGIFLGGIFGDLNAVTRPLQIGSNFTEDVNGNGFLDPGEDLDGDGRLDSDAVFITNNGGNGINIPGAGAYAVYNTFIDGNTLSGIDVSFVSTGTIDRTVISNNGLHGINMNSVGFFDQTLTMTNSMIQNNARDGIQLMSTNNGGRTNGTGAGNPEIEVTLNTNIIRDNGGRGIDTTVRGDGSASLDITDIIVTGNGEQGIYNLITASTTQSNEVSADVDLAQDGSIFANAFLDFSINATAGFNGTGQNLVANNGLTDTYDGGGLVFRVGTTGAVANLFRPYENSNSVNPTALGGLLASIEDTNIIGNNGVDLWIQTFTSTVDPATTAGAWTDQNTNPRDNTNDDYTPSSQYQQDPLARIRITALSNMTGGSVDVFGISDPFSTGNNQNFAFYNNNESEFKSRGTTNVGPDNPTDGGVDDNGPFNSGTRPRNATRLADRSGFTTYDTDGAGVTTRIAGAALPPGLTIFDTGGNSDNFLFPGMGLSTMQIATGADITLGGFTTVISDFSDDINFTQASGLVFFRDVDFMWDTF